ncbi:carbohydrate sulfotransferase 10-like [Mercenaria mercenaria]|uniref:carbohydrate sulfotransferase 10-like n=1 Tax=Mercenaria mercenaria TaxID=6596 RepID=UPI00234F052F|nr:carbohydrate sulfotransferase 10-like [Mercenaria mercenaria]
MLSVESYMCYTRFRFRNIIIKMKKTTHIWLLVSCMTVMYVFVYKIRGQHDGFKWSYTEPYLTEQNSHRLIQKKHIDSEERQHEKEAIVKEENQVQMNINVTSKTNADMRHHHEIYSSDKNIVQRLQLIKYKCKHYFKSKQLDQSSVISKGTIFAIPTKINYCETPKVGCTFWKSILRFIARDYPKGRQPRKPTDIDRWYVHFGNWDHIKKYSDLNEALESGHLLNGYNFMFAREPYSRLWSAYLDKFYLPDFWATMSKKIRPVDKSKCAHDVTFKEFLSFIVKDSIHLDRHWTPLHRLCSPCHVNYDAIGKMETFNDDSKFILERLGYGKLMNFTKKNPNRRGKEEIFMLAKYNLSFKNSSCFNHKLIANRLWSVFQMNGFLSKELTFPFEMFKDEMFYNKTGTTAVFLSYAFKALDYTKISNINLGVQKYQFMINAYRTIPLSLLYKVQKLFQLDFELFGYDAEPIDIFSWQ